MEREESSPAFQAPRSWAEALLPLDFSTLVGTPVCLVSSSRAYRVPTIHQLCLVHRQMLLSSVARGINAILSPLWFLTTLEHPNVLWVNLQHCQCLSIFSTSFEYMFWKPPSLSLRSPKPHPHRHVGNTLFPKASAKSFLCTYRG